MVRDYQVPLHTAVGFTWIEQSFHMRGELGGERCVVAQLFHFSSWLAPWSCKSLRTDHLWLETTVPLPITVWIHSCCFGSGCICCSVTFKLGIVIFQQLVYYFLLLVAKYTVKAIRAPSLLKFLQN